MNSPNLDRSVAASSLLFGMVICFLGYQYTGNVTSGKEGSQLAAQPLNTVRTKTQPHNDDDLHRMIPTQLRRVCWSTAPMTSKHGATPHATRIKNTHPGDAMALEWLQQWLRLPHCWKLEHAHEASLLGGLPQECAPQEPHCLNLRSSTHSEPQGAGIFNRQVLRALRQPWPASSLQAFSTASCGLMSPSGDGGR